MPSEYEFDVFISYSSHDKTWVRGELLPRVERAGLKAFIDFRDFTPGAPSIQEMERGIVECRKTLLILTPDYIKSEWCELEGVMIQTLSPANRDLRLIPLLKKECKTPIRTGTLVHIDFTDGADFVLAWRQLLAALKESSAMVHTGATDHQKKILVFVSRGGTCRDPMAKAITMQLLEQRKVCSRIEVRAAGLGPLSGSNASLAARIVIREMYGEDLLEDHRPEILTEDLVARADLILAMDKELLGPIGKTFPRNKTLLLKEFFGLEGNVNDPWDDNKTDVVTIQRYRECAEELRTILTNGMDHLVNTLNL